MTCYIKSLAELNYDKEEDLVKKYIDKQLFTKIQAGYKKLVEKNREQGELLDLHFRLYIANICDIKENFKVSTLNFIQFAKGLHDMEMCTELSARISELSSNVEKTTLDLLLDVLKANQYMTSFFSTIGMTDSYYTSVQKMLSDRKKGLLDSLSDAQKRVKARYDELNKANSIRRSQAITSRLKSLEGGKTRHRKSKKHHTRRRA